jgi:L-ascorbate metabolism protein UlaG (beta-lactamase superfamily)
MEIKYIAHSSFIIKTKGATIVTDPYSADIGIKFPKTEADIITVSHDHSDHSNTRAVDGAPTIFDWPGEFEVKGVSLTGISTYHDAEKGSKRGSNIMYRFTTEGMKLLHCGDLGHELDDKTLELVGSIDILFIPVGGSYTIDSATAVKIARQIDPYIIVPMHYAYSELDQKTFGQLESVDKFIHAFGGGTSEKLQKMNIKREDIASETTTRIVLLEPTA